MSLRSPAAQTAPATVVGSLPHNTEAAAFMAREIGPLVLKYVTERRTRGELRRESVRTVRYTLGTLVQVVGWDFPVDRLRTRHIERWRERRPLSEATQRSQLSIVRNYCVWLMRRGYAQVNPTLDVVSPRQPRYVPRGVRSPAVGAVLLACPDARAELIIELEVQQGLRACEVVGLQLGDVDPDERLMLIRGKGGHERVLPITDETWAAMGRYLAEHPATAGPLIRSYNHSNRAISAKYCSRIVAGWMHEAGLKETGHALRHTAATDMLRAGAHVRDVQQALGHSSLGTTQRYMPWLVGDLRKAMSGRVYQPVRQPTLFDADATPVGTPAREGGLSA